MLTDDDAMPAGAFVMARFGSEDAVNMRGLPREFNEDVPGSVIEPNPVADGPAAS